MTGRLSGLHGGDDVGGIKRIGQTGRAAAGADANLIKQEEKRLGLDAVEGDIRGIGEALGGMATVSGRCIKAVRRAS